MASAYPGITPGATIQRNRKFQMPRTFTIPTTRPCSAKNNERLMKSSKDHMLRCVKLSPNEIKMNRLDAEIKCRNNPTCLGKRLFGGKRAFGYGHVISQSS